MYLDFFFFGSFDFFGMYFVIFKRLFFQESTKMNMDEKLQLIKHEMEVNREFEQYINQGIMRFGGDTSLLAVHHNAKKPHPK